MKLLTIDAETNDPYIGRGLGSGWVFGLNVPDSDFRVLGFAVRDHRGKEGYLTDMDKVKRLVDDHDAMVMHNASYDIGCLHNIGANIKDKPIFDTEVMGRLYRSCLMSYKLDELSKRYLFKVSKMDEYLINSVRRHGLYEGRLKNPKDKDLLKYAKSHMGQIQDVDFEAMANYAKGDTAATYQLCEFFLNNGVDKEQALRYSGLSHICVDYRMRGVRVDICQARDSSHRMVADIAQKISRVYDIAGEEFNIASPKEVPAVFDKLKIKYPKTEKGNPSITKGWLEKQQHEICRALVEARQSQKIKRDFIDNIIDMQDWTGHGGQEIGRIYPELNLLRARTGRFSCSNPNIQQIPSRDPVYGPICRGMYLPEEGKTWFSLDFSNQEGRLQVHYAYLLKAEGAAELVQRFKENPHLDLHGEIATMIGVSRRETKAINLGLGYGMGDAKLAISLGISSKEAKALRVLYNSKSPFLSKLNDRCKLILKTRGYINTIGGRKSHIDPPGYKDGSRKTYEYKALNKLIQGSAADQTIACMEQAYVSNIPVLFPVHDELCMSGTREQAENLKCIMESAIILSVPSVTEIKQGPNWGNLEIAD